MVDNRAPKQEFWQVGTTMAYLAVLYDKLRRDWGYSAEAARPYLDSALLLLDFEATMPLETYLWPSKCKVAWGAGELLRVLVHYALGSAEQVELAYQAARKTAVFTFMDNQLPHGGWSCMHYPSASCPGAGVRLQAAGGPGERPRRAHPGFADHLAPQRRDHRRVPRRDQVSGARRPGALGETIGHRGGAENAEKRKWSGEQEATRR